jgi:3-oxoacyl-[acyl-carrier-protein] synthase-1
MASYVRAAALAAAWPSAPGWMQRAEAMARSVAASLRQKADVPKDIPCFVGSSSHFIGAIEGQREPKLDPPVEFAQQLARWFGVSGPVMAVNTACTSGLTALGLARDMVESGAAPHALVLGVELANRLTTLGFASLGLLSASGARPCDATRDGLVLGEALAAVVVSGSGEWRIAGLSTGIDPSGVAAPAPSPEVIARAMRAALAGWTEVDLLKLQAGGSPDGDLAEARAVRSVFKKLPRHLVSFKGEIGHTLGASGPAELALLLDALARGAVPATVGFSRPDPELGLEPKAGDGRSVRRVLFNLAGFGGHVASLALERR